MKTRSMAHTACDAERTYRGCASSPPGSGSRRSSARRLHRRAVQTELLRAELRGIGLDEGQHKHTRMSMQYVTGACLERTVLHEVVQPCALSFTAGREPSYYRRRDD